MNIGTAGHPRKFISLFLIWIAFIFIYYLLRTHTFLSSLVHDDGLFLYGGQAWAGGHLPYHDFWDHKAPGIFFYHSLPLRLFPFSLFAVKFHQVLWMAASATLLLHMLRRYFTLGTSLLATALYVFFTSMPHTIRSGGLTEESALFFIILTYHMALRTHGHFMRNSFLCGLAIGVAIQFRQTFVFSMIFVFSALLKNIAVRQDVRHEEKVNIFIDFLALFAGMALPELVNLIYFSWNGAWFEYFEASYLTNLYYVGPGRPDITWSEVLRKQWTFISHTGPYLYTPLLALATLRWLDPSLRWMWLPLFGTFVGEMISVSLSGEFYSHYYTQAAVSMAIYFAMFFDGLRGGMKRLWWEGFNRPGTISFILYAILLLLLTFIPLKWAVQSFAQEYQSILADRKREVGPFATERGIAAAVERLTAPEDRVLLIGRTPNSVYFFSKRYAGSRYYHYSPLWKEKFIGAVKERHLQQFESDLIHNHPALLLLDLTRTPGDDIDGGLIRIETRAPEVLPFIHQNYVTLDSVLPEDPEDLWPWYGMRMEILIHKDKVEEVLRNFELQQNISVSDVKT